VRNILFITKYPIEGPSSRYRVYQYIEYLEEKNYNCTVKPLMNSDLYKNIYLNNNSSLKNIFLRIYTEFKKTFTNLSAKDYDVIIIQKEITPWGINPFFLNKYKDKIIFDFDDAIFLKKSREVYMAYILKKVNSVIAGNDYLKEYATKYNNVTTIIPTPIDLKKYGDRKIHKEKDNIVIGWVGTKSNLKYIDRIKELIISLNNSYNITLEIVSNGKYQLEDKDINIINKSWSLEDEIRDIKSFDIGIMPLEDDEWTKGKCAFKAIQYMGLGIPTVSSNVGFNKEVIDNSKDGFLVTNQKEWKNKVELLINDVKLRNEIGTAARKKVEDHYSIQANLPKLIDAIEKI
jgi:glycosyltransferase involved in cell wall biosynthesis